MPFLDLYIHGSLYHTAPLLSETLETKRMNVNYEQKMPR